VEHTGGSQRVHVSRFASIRTPIITHNSHHDIRDTMHKFSVCVGILRAHEITRHRRCAHPLRQPLSPTLRLLRPMFTACAIHWSHRPSPSLHTNPIMSQGLSTHTPMASQQPCPRSSIAGACVRDRSSDATNWRFPRDITPQGRLFSSLSLGL